MLKCTHWLNDGPATQARRYEMSTSMVEESEASVTWFIDNDSVFDEEGNESPGFDFVHIDTLFVPVELRGQGLARRIMKEAIKNIKVEHSGLPIYLVACPKESAGPACPDMSELVDFYMSLGFDADDEKVGGSEPILRYYGE